MSEPKAERLETLKRRSGKPKGRVANHAIREEIQRLLGAESRSPDLLIEHLHKIQDKFGHISSQHILALADLMKLSQTEVYEVATFYHHFDVVKEGQTPPRRSRYACANPSVAPWPAPMA